MPDTPDTHSLLIRLGNFHRAASDAPAHTRRWVTTNDCVLLAKDSEAQPSYRFPFQLSFYERREGVILWKDDPDKIGAFRIGEESFQSDISVFLSPVVFNAIWNAAAASDGSMKNIQLDYYISNEGRIADIIGATYFEDFLSDTGTTKIPGATPSVVNPRINPVVAEMRTWSASVNSLSRGLTVLLVIWACFSIGGQIIAWVKSLN